MKLNWTCSGVTTQSNKATMYVFSDLDAILMLLVAQIIDSPFARLNGYIGIRYINKLSKYAVAVFIRKKQKI